MDTTKTALKNEVKKYAHEGREARKAIQATSGMDRYHAWNVKRGIGADARHRLLAYAFYRGVPYRVLERRCSEDLPVQPDPNGCRYRKVYIEVGILQAIHAALPETARAEWTQERVRAWMAVPLPEAAVEEAA